jgi:hypothetical protein
LRRQYAYYNRERSIEDSSLSFCETTSLREHRLDAGLGRLRYFAKSADSRLTAAFVIAQNEA